MSLLCAICQFPAVGKCPLTQKHVCSSICQNISYVRQLIGLNGKKRDEKGDLDGEPEKKKDKEEEETDPFTMTPISELEPNDVITFQGNKYSLAGLYRWFINDKKTKNPLKGNDVEPADMEQVSVLAIERFPFTIQLSSLGEQNRTITWTVLSNFENLAFFLLKTVNNVTVTTLMEFMQYITRRNIKFFMFNPDQSILDLIIEHNDNRLIDIPGLRNPLNVLVTVMIQYTSMLQQIELCIRLARRRKKGYDMFQTRGNELRNEIRREERRRNPGQQQLILFIDDEEYEVYKRENESLYDAFHRVFNDNYEPATQHDEWFVLSGRIEEADSRGNSDLEGGFPFKQGDFDDLDNEEILTVRVTEEYEPPSIDIEFYWNDDFVEEVEVNPEDMLYYLDTDEKLRTYARQFPLNEILPREGMYEINIIMEWAEDQKKTFVLGTNIFYEIFKFMGELRDEFHHYAGPWVGDDIDWVIRVEYNKLNL